MEREQLIDQAKRILRDESALDTAELISRAQALESNRALRYAHLLLIRARDATSADDPLRRTVAHRLARCTYKDPDLPVFDRLDEAERILSESDDPATSNDQETLGLAGAIQKRRWEVYAQKHFLERALAFYRRGYERGPEHDSGYTGINTAFALDVLAHEEQAEARRAGAVSTSALSRRAEADRIRDDIAEVLEARRLHQHDWWSMVTAAEAHFGLRRYDEARTWLERAASYARESGVPDWQRESTAHQLAHLYRIQADAAATAEAFAHSPPGRALLALLGDNLHAVLGAYRGKVGLALSGGGFRAALFHIGVLARLAEVDALRHIEVLSCVSGGSIIGAHYYLELRALLESKPDDLIDHQDYIDIVRRIECDFLAGVQSNIRMRMIGNIWRNIRMILSRDYSRTHRVGELYEERIYSRIRDGNGLTPRWLNGLFMRPHGEGLSFHPSYDNWRRSNKVPALVLNATSLNTGHAWQFTASWMGEPPTTLDDDIDCNDHYRRMYYREAPKKHRSFRLGYAVAASSCVPGLFEPLPLVGLYPDRTVRLVDGGVHDNQGIASLLEQNCDVILVSDASGQMTTIAAPGDGLLGVPLRSNDILMARVRESQYRELTARRRSSTLRGLMFLHLKKDLQVNAVDWIGCDEPGAPGLAQATTSFGVRKDLQEKLAGVRTDLDSFSDLEAYALMASGYRMARHELASCLPDLEAAGSRESWWRFRSVEPLLSGDGDARRTTRLVRVLDAASARALKVWSLLPVLRVTRVAIIAAAVLALAYFLVANRAQVAIHLTWGDVLRRIVPIVVAAVLGGAVAKVLWARSTFTQFARRIAAVAAGWLVAGVHLFIFDKLYLRYGRVPEADQAHSEERVPAAEGRVARREPTVAAPPAQVRASMRPPPESAAPEHEEKSGSAPAQPDAAGVEAEPVFLGASAPRAVRPGDEFTARFVAYINSLETEVRRTLEGLSPGSASHLGVQTCRWKRGTRVTVRLHGQHLVVDTPEESFVWQGERSLVEFDVRVANDAPQGTTILKFDVSIDGIRVAKLRVDLTISTAADGAARAAIAEPARTAFASYSSEDRARVLDRIASIRTAADVDVFLDCLSLRPGDEWKPALEREIKDRDLFLLFWSSSARQSRWVEWEWKTALASRGVENIEPHPLDPVSDAPPPPELGALHFGDPLMLIRDAVTEERTP